MASVVVIMFAVVCVLPAVRCFQNIDGRVLELNESSFDAAISSFEFVLVDFYAPWCRHCRHLSPELDKAAPMLSRLKNPIVIAKVDADKYTHLASKHEIVGFPTLKIFMHGVPTDYDGPTNAELLVQFVRKFIAPDVAVLESDSGISEFVEAAGNSFPIFVGFGLNESAISDLAKKYKSKAWFSVAKSFSNNTNALYDFNKVPALVALHPRYDERSSFYGPFEDKFVEEFIKWSLLPLTLPINRDTMKLLNDDDRKIVLTIIKDETDDESKNFIKLLKAAASANRDFIFGYVGFNQWQDLAECFEVNKKTALPKMVVWDGTERYFSVVGLESIYKEDQESQIKLFMERFRAGSVVEKEFGPSLMVYLASLIGTTSMCVVAFLVATVVLLVWCFGREEPLVSIRDPVDMESTSLLEASRIEKED